MARLTGHASTTWFAPLSAPAYGIRGLIGALILAASTLAWAQADLPPLGYKLTPVTPNPPPDVTQPDFDGKPLSLADLRGKVVMLNFWATWCPPCRREMPSMDEVHRALKDRPFSVVAINQWEDPEQVFAWMGFLPAFPDFPILFDREGTVAQAYKVAGLPMTFLIDRTGRVVYRAVGGRDFHHPEVVQIIEALIGQGG